MHANGAALVSWFLMFMFMCCVCRVFNVFMFQPCSFLPSMDGVVRVALSPDVLTGSVRAHVVAVRAHDHSTMPVPPSSPVAHVLSPRATAFRGSLAAHAGGVTNTTNKAVHDDAAPADVAADATGDFLEHVASECIVTNRRILRF